MQSLRRCLDRPRMLWPRLLREWYKHAPPTKSEAIDRNCGGGFWLLAAGLLSVTTSLVVRVIHRGPYIPGRDLIAPTQGHFLASTLPIRDALREAWYQNRHFWLPFPVYSIPFSLIPGYLGLLWAWPYGSTSAPWPPLSGPSYSSARQPG